MQTWSISYTSDKNKPKNRHWLQGKLNFNASTGRAYFYDEEGLEIGCLKLTPNQLVPDSQWTLSKHLIEVGLLEKEEACVEDLFAKLNKELGISEFNHHDKKEKENKKMAAVSVNKPTNRMNTKLKPRIPTPVAKDASTILHDILYTFCRNQKSPTTPTKWQDGLLKFHPTLKLAEFYDETGRLLHKKTMEMVKVGELIEEAAGGSLSIEICGIRRDQTQPASSSGTSKNRKFAILYTRDKQKKSKKWLDARMDYDESTKLAKFIDEESGDCFYKKIIAEIDVGGDAFETGMYLIQIDHEILGESEAKNLVVLEPRKPPLKSIVANENVPLSGRSNAELLSLLHNYNKNKENE